MTVYIEKPLALARSVKYITHTYIRPLQVFNQGMWQGGIIFLVASGHGFFKISASHARF